jgi:hypothetical protein
VFRVSRSCLAAGPPVSDSGASGGVRAAGADIVGPAGALLKDSSRTCGGGRCMCYVVMASGSARWHTAPPHKADANDQTNGWGIQTLFPCTPLGRRNVTPPCEDGQNYGVSGGGVERARRRAAVRRGATRSWGSSIPACFSRRASRSVRAASAASMSDPRESMRNSRAENRSSRPVNNRAARASCSSNRSARESTSCPISRTACIIGAPPPAAEPGPPRRLSCCSARRVNASMI